MSERVAVFPGTFDPLTSGHLDVIRRGARLFERLVVGVAENAGKDGPVFTAAERVGHIRELTDDLTNVSVESYTGMTVDFVKSMGARIILRGIRTFGDFEYECRLALANRAFAGVETVFVMASEENAFVSSTLIKEAVNLGADASRFVPDPVLTHLRERLGPAGGESLGLGGEEAG
jgi:pantetheine-phosphate adenylyltransferase